MFSVYLNKTFSPSSIVSLRHDFAPPIPNPLPPTPHLPPPPLSLSLSLSLSLN